ncbi:MAG TPA: DUF1800 domain-containing protein [Chthoniobacterales bacterium]
MLTPLPAEKWSFTSAAHLLNRAGFGGTPDEIETVQRAGLPSAVDRLLHPPNEPLEPDDSQPWRKPEDLRTKLRALRELKSQPEERKARVREMRMEGRDELLDLRDWWLGRMQSSPAPLVEKLTLFWHGHFATSAQKVKNVYWMWRQNETFRRNALGNFKTLLREISRDPAMMIYLDLAQSRESHPNENWAREVMELFTLGIGHYTEEDIREAARAFTGYRLNLTNQQFRFAPREEDRGLKKFLGQSGNFSGDDILDIIVAQPACAEWIGRKLCRFFIADDPSSPLVTAVAASLRKNGFELGPVLREIFTSTEFYSDQVIRSQIKSPVQFLVQSCKLLETGLPPRGVTQNALQQMGQVLFAPPNVKGWDGGKSWISTSTLLFRYNFANYLLNGTRKEPLRPDGVERVPADLANIIPVELRGKPTELVTHLARRFYQSQPNDKQIGTFLAYLQSRAPDRSDETTRGLLHLMMSTPPYQLT